MRYILAIILPPFALLVCGKPFQFVINFIFWILSIPLMMAFGFGIVIWMFCTFHALIVCATQRADRQMNRIVSAIESRNQTQLGKY